MPRWAHQVRGEDGSVRKGLVNARISGILEALSQSPFRSCIVLRLHRAQLGRDVKRIVENDSGESLISKSSKSDLGVVHAGLGPRCSTSSCHLPFSLINTDVPLPDPLAGLSLMTPLQ